MWFLAALTAVLALSQVRGNCYAPSGTDCNWYRDCLEATTRCAGTPYDYAMKYATFYCNKYEANKPSFSDTGKRWINAVKRCLQLKLVPYLNSGNCAAIQTFAFQSHVECYVSPALGEPSFCSLPLSDWTKVFSTIKGAFLTQFSQTVGGGWETFTRCVG